MNDVKVSHLPNVWSNPCSIQREEETNVTNAKKTLCQRLSVKDFFYNVCRISAMKEKGCHLHTDTCWTTTRHTSVLCLSYWLHMYMSYVIWWLIGWYLDVMFLRYTPCIRTPDPDLTTKSVKRDKISSVNRFYPWKSDRCLRATNGGKKFNKLEKVLVYHTIPVLFYLTAQISVIYYVQKWLPADGLNQTRPTAQLTLRRKSWRSSLDREQWDLIHLNYGACFNGQHVCTCTSAWCQHA